MVEPWYMNPTVKTVRCVVCRHEIDADAAYDCGEKDHHPMCEACCMMNDCPQCAANEALMQQIKARRMVVESAMSAFGIRGM
jgi:hypothetical protein